MAALAEEEWVARFAALARERGLDATVRPHWAARAVRAFVLCDRLAGELDRHPPGSSARAALARDYARAYRLWSEARIRSGAPAMRI